MPIRRACLSLALLLTGALLLLPLTRAQEQANPAVDKVFEDLTKPGSPGCALGVYGHGKIMYAKGYGLANIEENTYITPQSVFDIGSTSKQFTAASILLLEKQGELRLEDDIRQYIPELPDYGQKITILNLLNHTSGLRDYIALMELGGIHIDSVTIDDDALAYITRQKALNFSPGSDFLYSNTGFFLLSMIVKRASGKTLREFAAENIFQPLGMTHTTYRDNHTLLVPHRAFAYDPKEKGGYALNISYWEQTGDGGVHTSVEDLQKWDENFYSGQVGGRDFLEEIQERGKLTGGKTLEYGKGLFIGEHRGLRTVRHGGAWGGYRAELLRFPEQHFSVACLCNVANANPSRRADEVAEVYLGRLMKPKENAPTSKASGCTRPSVTVTPEQLQSLAGTYRDAAKGTISRIALKEGKLVAEMFGQTAELCPLSMAEFAPMAFPVDIKIRFEPASRGKPRLMKITGTEMLAGTLEQVPPISPSATELSAYVGAYASEELDAVYRLGVADGKLKLIAVTDPAGFPRATSIPASELRPIIVDEFELAGAPVTLHFTRDLNRAVNGFTLDAGRTRGMIFTRKNGANR